MPTQRESIRNLINILKDWQKIEDLSVQNTKKILKNTNNPLVRIVIEIIRQDSAMHKRVQQLIIDNFEVSTISVNPDELTEFWKLLESHEELELKTIELAEKAMSETTSQLAKYLLSYLLTDERKHNMLLEELDKAKHGVYPYGKIENNG